MIEYLCNVFETLNEIVYLADASTYELYYLNEHARRLYDCHSLEDLKGKKCYEVMHGRSVPCRLCQNEQLKLGRFYEWRYHDQRLDRFFMKKDTLIEHDGHQYRFGMSVDTTAQAAQEEVLNTMQLTEETINEVLSEALREENSTKSINTFIRLLGEKTRSERVYIFEQHTDYVCNTFEWCADGISAQIDSLQRVPMDVVRHWYDSFALNRNIVIPDVEDIKETDPLAYEYLKPQDIHSLVVSPLILEGRIIGFYGADNPPRETLTNISNMAWIVGHFLVSLLQKNQLIRHLEELSYFEQLTGLQNRHAMNAKISANRTLNKLGVVYCDVMGLKKINDTLGHQAGDDLLQRAAACLKQHFRLTDLYRIGGDEFLVICTDIDEGDFFQRVEKLRRDMVTSDALMALGSVWHSSADDADAVIADADKLMYAEKQAHYAATTEQ